MVSSASKLESIDEQLFDSRITNCWISGWSALKVCVNLLKHDQVALDFISDPSQLFFFLDNPAYQHLVPVMLEHLPENLRWVLLPLLKHMLRLHEIMRELAHVSWVMIVRNVLLPQLGEHVVNVEVRRLLFFQWRWRHEWVITIIVESHHFKEALLEVLLLFSAMFNQESALSGLAEVSVEEYGLVWLILKWEESVRFRVWNGRILIPCYGLESTMPILFVVYISIRDDKLRFFIIHLFLIWSFAVSANLSCLDSFGYKVWRLRVIINAIFDSFLHSDRLPIWERSHDVWCSIEVARLLLSAGPKLFNFYSVVSICCYIFLTCD